MTIGCVKNNTNGLKVMGFYYITQRITGETKYIPFLRKLGNCFIVGAYNTKKWDQD